MRRRHFATKRRRPAEWHQYQRAQKQDRHDAEHVVEGLRGGLPAHNAREHRAGHLHRLVRLAARLRHAIGERAEHGTRMLGLLAQCRADAARMPGDAVAQPAIDRGNADGATKIAHQIKQAGPVAQIRTGQAAQRQIDRGHDAQQHGETTHSLRQEQRAEPPIGG